MSDVTDVYCQKVKTLYYVQRLKNDATDLKLHKYIYIYIQACINVSAYHYVALTYDVSALCQLL